MTRLSFSRTICLLLTVISLLTISCKQIEESKVKETANQYMKGRIKLERGDSLQLKSVTEPLLFRFITLNEQYFKMVDAPTIREDLRRISAGEVKIDGQKATCRMTGHDYYTIHLIKTGNSWKVIGENNQYMTAEKIAELSKKIADQIVFKQNKPAIYSVIKVVNLFFEGVRKYIKEGNISELAAISTPDTRDMIQKFYRYAIHRSGEDLLLKEIEKFNMIIGDVTFDGDHAEYKFAFESRTINLIKQDNQYKVSGLEGLNCGVISQQIMADNYLNLLRALKLVRKPEYRLPEFK